MSKYLKNINLQLFVATMAPLGFFYKKGEGGGLLDITLLIYVVLYVMVIYNMVIKKEKLTFFKYDWLVYLVLVVMSFSLLYTPEPMDGLVKFMKFTVMGVGMIYILRSFIKNRDDIIKFYKYFVFNSFVVQVLILFDFAANKFPVGRYKYHGVHPIATAMLGATCMLIMLMLFSAKKVKFSATLVLLLISSSILIIGASKGPILAIAITLFLMLKGLKKVNLKLMLLLGVILIVLLNLSAVQKYTEFLTDRISNTAGSESSAVRLNLYDQAERIFYENPIIGAGIGTLKEYPHNLFLEILAENGLLLGFMLIIVLLMVCKSYFGFLLDKSLDVSYALSLSLVIMSFVSLMVSWTYVDQKYLYMGLGTLIMVHASLVSRPKYEVDTLLGTEKTLRTTTQ
jgi:O-antigen ligase